jgi:hypothetical protein
LWTGLAGEVGIAIPNKANDICAYHQECYTLGGHLVAEAGISGAIGSGQLSSGTSMSRGVSWGGGAGLAGSGQITKSSDGNYQGARGLLGVGVGGFAAYIRCRQVTKCLRR